MLSVLITKIKRMGKTFRGDGYVYGIDCAVSQIHTNLQTHQVVYIKYVQLSVCQLYSIKCFFFVTHSLIKKQIKNNQMMIFCLY